MLTTAQKARVFFHLDYAQLSTPTTLSLGLAVVTQARFVIEQNLEYLDPTREGIVLEIVAQLDCILAQRTGFRQSLEVTAVGSTKIRGPEAFAQLEDEYRLWRNKLADALAAQQNPVSNAAAHGRGGVIEPC
jgi:hypothetical protein